MFVDLVVVGAALVKVWFKAVFFSEESVLVDVVAGGRLKQAFTLLLLWQDADGALMVRQQQAVRLIVAKVAHSYCCSVEETVRCVPHL